MIRSAFATSELRRWAGWPRAVTLKQRRLRICPFRGSSTRPAHSLCTLRSRGRPRTKQHSILADGHSLDRSGLSPAGAHRWSTVMSLRQHGVHRHQASPGAIKVMRSSSSSSTVYGAFGPLRRTCSDRRSRSCGTWVSEPRLAGRPCDRRIRQTLAGGTLSAANPTLRHETPKRSHAMAGCRAYVNCTIAPAHGSTSRFSRIIASRSSSPRLRSGREGSTREPR